MSVGFNSPTAAEIHVTGVGSFSQAYVLAAGGSNLCAVARIGWDVDVATVSAITYAGATMTSVGAKVGNASNDQVQLFTKTAPATGSNTFAVTMSTTVSNLNADIGSYNTVDQVSPVRSGSYTTNAGPADGAGTLSITIPSVAGDMAIGDIEIGDAPTIQGGATEENENSLGAAFWASGRLLAAGSTTVISWNTATAGIHGVLAGFSLQQASVGGGASWWW